MSKTRVFSAAEKVLILKKHLVEKRPVSDLCDEYNIHVNTFYNWIKIFFDNGTAAFEANKPKPAADPKDKKIELLEAKLTRKNEVMAELLEAHTTLKKSLGDS